MTILDVIEHATMDALTEVYHRDGWPRGVSRTTVAAAAALAARKRARELIERRDDINADEDNHERWYTDYHDTANAAE